MKLSDLMIGDWVYVEKFGKLVRVESVGYTIFAGYEHFKKLMVPFMALNLLS